MSEFMQNVQVRIKNSSGSIFLFGFKLVTGLFLGLTMALIGQEMIGYKSFAFTFVILTFCGFFLKISKRWSVVSVVVFNLVFVLIGLLLRMYILISPGA